MPARGTVSVLLLRPLALLLTGVPGALDAFYGATDLTPELLADTEARVSPSQFCVAWSEAARLSGDPNLALGIAAAIPWGAFGVVEYVCRSAPTLGDAIRQWVRYLNLLDDAVTVGILEEGGNVCVRVVAESEAPAPPSHELCFALLVSRGRELTRPSVRALSIDFTHRGPADPSAHRRWFDAPVRFGAPHTQLVLSREAADTPLVTADPSLFALLSKYADDLQARDRSEPTLSARVERILRTALRNDDAHVDRVAKQLGMTARSLQRRLRDEGTSFQAMREDVRRRLATRYLDDDLSITEIAFLLGFSEPSAFFRAFKRWTGTTPHESRAMRRGAPAAG